MGGTRLLPARIYRSNNGHTHTTDTQHTDTRTHLGQRLVREAADLPGLVPDGHVAVSRGGEARELVVVRRLVGGAAGVGLRLWWWRCASVWFAPAETEGRAGRWHAVCHARRIEKKARQREAAGVKKPPDQRRRNKESEEIEGRVGPSARHHGRAGERGGGGAARRAHIPRHQLPLVDGLLCCCSIEKKKHKTHACVLSVTMHPDLKNARGDVQEDFPGRFRAP